MIFTKLLLSTNFVPSVICETDNLGTIAVYDDIHITHAIPYVMQKSFDCLCFLDNHNLCILEIARSTELSMASQKSYEWLLLQKSDMSISTLSLKSRDDSFYVQERYFNLGYLKYNQHDGIFIERSNTGQHPLENRECTGIPETYLQVVEDYLEKMVKMPSIQEIH